jgi:putative transposase
VWIQGHPRWQKRDLSAKRYSYCWADGIHLEARLEAQAQCILVIIGATPEGRKELVGFTDGIRESSQSWRDLLLDLKRRGLTTAPQIAVVDGSLGFWLRSSNAFQVKSWIKVLFFAGVSWISFGSGLRSPA